MNGSEKAARGFWAGTFQRFRQSARRGDLFPYRKMLCTELCAMGVEARMAQRGRPEEKTGRGSLGIIGVARSPIRWINVRLVGMGDASEDFVDYGVPDSRHLPQVEIKSNWVQTFPILGKTIDVRWEGDDGGTGIMQLLTNDETIRNAIMGTCLVTIRTCPEHGCWLIVQKRYTWNSPLLRGYQWRCYEKIAEILLATPVPP